VSVKIIRPVVALPWSLFNKINARRHDLWLYEKEAQNVLEIRWLLFFQALSYI
jgi:hypothetical protein